MPPSPNRPGCRNCQGAVPAPDFTMAFQPIVDTEHGTVYAHEALPQVSTGALNALRTRFEFHLLEHAAH